jgi:hypothetical protein
MADLQGPYSLMPKVEPVKFAKVLLKPARPGPMEQNCPMPSQLVLAL